MPPTWLVCRDPSVTGAATIGVDIGGSKILAGVVDSNGRVLARARVATPHLSTTPLVVEDTIVDAVRRLRSENDLEVAAAGIGAAGFVDAAGALVRFSPHLSWRDEPVRDALAGRLDLPVVLDNDANAAAAAEMAYGAGRGHRQVLCLTLGTGIGGALVIDGRVFRGANGMAGEFGHMQVVPGGRACECGNRGCWEQYSSGNALVRAARELLKERSAYAHVLHELAAGDPANVTGPLVTRAAAEGDRATLAIFQEVGGWLGTGLAGFVAAFDPELVIVGGGVSDAGDLLLDPAREALRRTLTGRGFRPEPPLVTASLGADAGFIGAAVVAREVVHER